MIRQLSDTMNQNITLRLPMQLKLYFGMHVKPPSVNRKLTDN